MTLPTRASSDEILIPFGFRGTAMVMETPVVNRQYRSSDNGLIVAQRPDWADLQEVNRLCVE
jgi:hypothetical protein